MSTAAERQALAFLAVVALLGGGARAWEYRKTQLGAHVTLAAVAETVSETVGDQIAAVDSARGRRRRRGAGSSTTDVMNTSSDRNAPRPRTAAIPIIDVDVATAQELEQLPRIGPALAERIVANRDSLGAFGSLGGLTRVRGIGPALAKVLEPLVTFSGSPRSIPNTQRRRR